MSGFLAAVAAFLGKFLKELLPTVINELRKPTTIINVGGKETVDSVSDSVAQQLDTAHAEESKRLKGIGLIEESGALIRVKVVDGITELTILTTEYKELVYLLTDELPKLFIGSPITVLDKHIIFTHPITKLETAVHRVIEQ